MTEYRTNAAREVRIVRGAVSPDHIHMLVSAPPQLAPSKLVQYVKGRSARRLGAVDEATIKQYIENPEVG